MIKKKSSLLITCLLASVGLHLFFLSFLAKNPLILHNRLAALFRKSIPPQEMVAADIDLLRQQELEETFQEFVKMGPKETPFDLKFHPSDAFKQPLQEQLPSLPLVSSENIELEETPVLPSLVIPSLAFTLSNLDHLEQVKDSEDSTFTQIALDKTSSIDPKKLFVAQVSEEIEESDDLGLTSHSPIAIVEPILPSFSILESFKKEPSVALDEMASALDPPKVALKDQQNAPSYILPQIPTPVAGELSSLSFSDTRSPPTLDTYLVPEMDAARPWDDAFEVRVQLMPHPEGTGYVFSLNLTPTQEIHMESMPQNYYFLIDRSSSIERHRFAAFKRAVLKALSCLQSGDKFNIILFDKKVKRLQPAPILFSKATLQQAEEFLEKEEHAGPFASGDLYASLSSIVPKDLSEQEMHTAILITGGESSQSVEKQRKHISRWLDYNAGEVFVYTAAVGQGNQLILLDLLSSCTGGRLLYSDTHAAFPRKLGKLLLDLRNPLIKDLSITAVPKHAHTEITFYPSGTQHPCLFAKQPYEIVGTIADLSDFTLLIQGRYKGQWVSISKEVSLKGAPSSRLLEKRWAKARGKSQYENFLKEGKVAHLLKAKELLKSSGNELAL